MWVMSYVGLTRGHITADLRQISITAPASHIPHSHAGHLRHVLGPEGPEATVHRLPRRLSPLTLTEQESTPTPTGWMEALKRTKLDHT
jgi:hypothetical protein